MDRIYTNYLKIIEDESLRIDICDHYLWPETPINDIQSKIMNKVGATDFQVDIRYSRPAMIIRQLEHLTNKSYLKRDFSILDIACGDGIILWQIKKRFQSALCLGVDCNKDKIETHHLIQKDGVYLFNVFIQQLILKKCERPFDVVMILNTYRSWKSSGINNPEGFKGLVDEWLNKNARYAILTATQNQIAQFKNKKLNVQVMGRGESNALMLCVSKESIPPLPLMDRLYAWVRLKRAGICL